MTLDLESRIAYSSAAMQCPDERVMLDLVAGRLPPAETAVRDHLDVCESCRNVVVALSSSIERAHPLVPLANNPATIGRYVVVDEVGRGAMATVYRARDPELEREIALKLVHFHDGGTSAERLLREARAMAKLTHPNVTRIYDAGTEGESVFLAMELVVGMDLARWLRDRRTWREVCDVFVAAADGLVAAHGHRLIHRDFKPGNVLVGDDGRVLVTDFGLVHTPGEHERALEPSQPASDVVLTRTGTIVGTPAYMAPELLSGAAADELTDQFSFCVALFEGVYGIRPYAGDDLATLSDNVRAGRVRELPADHDVPRWLHQIVLRGLGPRERRYRSMAELADAMRAGTRRPRRRVVAASSAITLAALVSVAVVVTSSPDNVEPDPCEAGEARIATVWSPARARELEAAFTRTKLAHAADAWVSSAGRLDRFRTEWIAGYRAACTASRAGIQSGELLDRRMQCLESRRQELDQLVALFAAPDRRVVDQAPRTADALSRVADCANTIALGTLAPLPSAIDGAAVDRARAAVARVHVLRNAGDPLRVIENAEQALAEARKLDYAPLTAEASLAAAIVYMVANKAAQANRALDDAIVAAEAGRHFRIKAQALAVGMELAFNAGDIAGATSKDRLARAALAAIGGDPKLEADLESVLGWIASRQEDLPTAERHLRRALELRTAALGERDLATARAHANLGTAIGSRDPAGALVEYERAHAIELAELGPKHPAVGQTLGNIAIIHVTAGRKDKAVATAKEALQVLEATMPAEHPAVAFATLQLAGVYHQTRDYENALTFHRRAVERYEAGLAKDHPDVGRALTNLAATLAELERHAELVEVARRALAIQEKTLGSDSPGTATIRQNLAVGLAGIGKTDEALQQLGRALALRERAYGATDPRLLSTLLGIADVHQLRKDSRQQTATLERALALEPKVKQPRDRSLIARVKFGLARALRDRGDRGRARDLAQQALATYRELERAAEAREIEGWLARK